MCSNSKGRAAHLGFFLGVSAFVILLVAFLSNSWIITKEPVVLPNSKLETVVHFRIGFWEACPLVRRISTSSTTQVPRVSCSAIKYEGWSDVTHSDLGLWTPLELAPVFITKMRSCTVLTGSAVILLGLASLFALLGQCNRDNKTLIACGFFILGGLSLGSGLVVFATALSETLGEIQEYSDDLIDSGNPSVYDYRYGWCFFTASTAFILTNLAAVLTLSGYLKKFDSIDEMVRQMVPGAERKLQEHQYYYSNAYLSKQYMNVHQSRQLHQYEVEGCCNRGNARIEIEKFHPKYENEYNNFEPLLNKTPPDVCTTNKCVEFDNTSTSGRGNATSGSNVIEYNALAGQTVPITIKNHNNVTSNIPTSGNPVTYANLPPPIIKYGTLPHPLNAIQGNVDFKSKTLQHQKGGSSSATGNVGRVKKCVKIETFQTVPETVEFGKKSVSLQFSGSAV